MAGLPGAGKTTLARALAHELGGVVLSKDEVRAALFPASLIDYSPEQDDLCFGAVLSVAEYLGRRGRTGWVFLDGRTFSRSEQIADVVRRAESAGCEWKILHLRVADEVAEARLGRGDHPAANRDARLYREIKARFEPITLPNLELDMSGPLDAALKAALDYLKGTLELPDWKSRMGNRSLLP